ncbi:MAG: type I-E CRISPR-associated protein Cse2/CasB [Pseudomonadota bacterium]
MEQKQLTKQERFVAYVIKQCSEDSGFAACLRRADNPNEEDYSYRIMISFGIDINNDLERLPYALIGAALARSQEEHDGTANLGKALRHCFADEEQGQIRLRRLLACQSIEELCRVLRPILTLIASKSTEKLCYARLLQELLFFYCNPKQRARNWSKEYYRCASSEKSEWFETSSSVQV